MNVDNITVNTQSSIKLSLSKTIYFDPFKIDSDMHDADIIFVTHDHYDHYDTDSIKKVKNENTIIVAPRSMEADVKKIAFKDYVLLNPNEETNIDNINIKAVRAYNIDKPFHPKENDWLGYVVNVDNISYYVAGDTDNTEEALSVTCDVALIPIGGRFTMDVLEAATLAKSINPKVVIPTHYGSIVGNINDGKELRNNLNGTNIEVIEKL